MSAGVAKRSGDVRMSTKCSRTHRRMEDATSGGQGVSSSIWVATLKPSIRFSTSRTS